MPPSSSIDPSAAAAFVQGNPIPPPPLRPVRAPDLDRACRASPRRLVKRSRGPDVRAVMAYLPPDLAKRLQVYCVTHDVTISGLVSQLVEQFLHQQTG
jgi:hypothetical protein